MAEWKKYRKTGVTEMRTYEPGETLEGVSVSPEDTPGEGGMIARNADNEADQWYIAKAYFEKNYEEDAPEFRAKGSLDEAEERLITDH